jgi:hypothetical protein
LVTISVRSSRLSAFSARRDFARVQPQ